MRRLSALPAHELVPPGGLHLAEALRDGFHWCRRCAKRTTIEGAEFHQVTACCGGRNWKWCEPEIPDWEQIRGRK